MADRVDKSTELAADPKTLLDSLSCGIVAVDAAGAVLYVNPVAGAPFHLSPHAALGQPVRLLLPTLGDKLLACVHDGTSAQSLAGGLPRATGKTDWQTLGENFSQGQSSICSWT
jgi:PAS domain-containing protein